MAVLDFVKTTTDKFGSNFVPPENRTAEFDQDGTLWVEHPLYTQVVYCFDDVATLVKEKPELKGREPFKTVLSGNREAIAKLPLTLPPFLNLPLPNNSRLRSICSIPVLIGFPRKTNSWTIATCRESATISA